MSRSCKQGAEALKACLAETDCYKSGDYTMKECLQRTSECSALQFAYMTCRRSQLDNRDRIQGFKGTDSGRGSGM